jgi:hypothetical protein
LLTLLFAIPTESAAESQLCAKKRVKVRNGRIKLAAALRITEETACPKRFKAIPGALNDGSHIYGRGVDGNRVVSSDATLEAGSHQYESFTVAAGVTLTVPSGTVIKTTGDFVNNGTINVFTYITGGIEMNVNSTTLLTRAARPAMAGIARSGSGISGFGSNGGVVVNPFGNTGGLFLGGSATGPLITMPGPVGGGGGAAGDSDASGGFPARGGDGGGTLVVLSRGSITNNGTIDASGENIERGGGGGGGGILVFAARTSFASTDSIAVEGGFGGLSNSRAGAGGGGGGGGVTIISPSISGQDTINVSGGVGVLASAPGLVTANPRSSGGAGGASYGRGGEGGDVNTDGSATDSQNGGDGVITLLTIKPEGVF